MDPRGLVALWREGLLAQAVLNGRTRGYTRHPQLNRFRSCPSPAEAIAFYLREIHAESCLRGYCFDAARIGPAGRVEPIAVTRGQLGYEWAHLQAKLRARSPEWLVRLKSISSLKPHPLFRIVPGPVAEWEVLETGKRLPPQQGRSCLRLTGKAVEKM